MRSYKMNKELLLGSVVYLLTFVVLVLFYSKLSLGSAQIWLTFLLSYLSLIVFSLLSVIVGVFISNLFRIYAVKSFSYRLYLISVMLILPAILTTIQKVGLPFEFFLILNFVYVLVEGFVLWNV